MDVRARLVAWAGLALALSVATAPAFPSLVNQSAGDAFEGLFVAIPVVALLALIFALRWKELAGIMSAEGGATSRLPVRLSGCAIIACLVALEPVTGQNLASSGVAVVLTFYAASMLVNPTTARFILPYAAVYAMVAGAPAVLLWAFGEPLAVFASGTAEKLVSLAGFAVAWQGTQFQFLSKSGELVSGVVTPGCSSISSVTMFLGLLALMHIDLKKDFRSTAKLAVAGVLVLTFLDSVRILILLWVGYAYGSAALWGLHDWIGYALFLGFFLAALSVYSRMGRVSATAGMPSTAVRL